MGKFAEFMTGTSKPSKMHGPVAARLAAHTNSCGTDTFRSTWSGYYVCKCGFKTPVV